MLRKTLLVLLIILVTLLTWFWVAIGADLYALQRATSVTTTAEDYALQDDSRITIPALQPGEPDHYNPLKNIYWGDLHVHTRESFDAALFGTTLTIEDAYRFATGASLTTAGGERMQISRPLDFLAITDHAEGFGLRARCADSDLSFSERFNCYLMEEPNVLTFLLLAAVSADATEPPAEQAPGVYRNQVRQHPTLDNWPICSQGQGGTERCYRDANEDWARYRKLADAYNQPGTLTAFSAYEYSPALPKAGKHHRNVIFNGSELPEHATSYLDVGSAVELWQTLEKDCAQNCDFLTIPHNMNKGWGLFYSPYTWDGKAYDTQDWLLRQRREPLAEIYQVKGASECALGVGATDEECAFSQVLPPCAPGQEMGCALQTSFARQGLKKGLELEQQLGFNPLAFGFIGSTDTHNANPGDTEERDFVGKVAAASSPAIRRIREWPDREPYESTLQFHTSGGLAGVWAEENTRDAVFAALQRRETYATSGPRITLRFFAGWGIDESVSTAPDAIARVSAAGVPMGSDLLTTGDNDSSPVFFVWAAADPMSAPLQRIQMVKGWIDAQGTTHEQVQDIHCADNQTVNPATQRCPDNDAGVDTTNCQLTGSSGAEQLITTWHDPDYQAQQQAFYYVRVLQNPTCRWSTYDSIRLGQMPPSHVPATIRERAWSSPIWLRPTSTARAQ